MSDRLARPPIKRAASERGIFATAVVVLLVLVVALVLTGAYQWALADWETVRKSEQKAAEQPG
jgi:cytochrome c-type biogenesis protein CcmH/NrfG